MKKRSCILSLIAVLLITAACDDTTGTIGNSIVPEYDMIVTKTDTCYAVSKTIMANDSILASTSDVYLGQYTDEETGTIFNSGFITQFGCTEDFIFPEEGVIGNTSTYTKLMLYISDYYGDSLNAMNCEVYELDNTLVEGKPYYTNISPEEFYNPDKEPLATKTFNVLDFTQHDTILSGDYTRYIEISLPNSIGHKFISKFYEEGGKKYFENSEVFINNIFKGIYVKCAHGDGTVVKIYRARLDIGFDRYIKSSSGQLDSIQKLSAPFYSGKEVLQTNKFDNSGLESLLETDTLTHIKTPAGLFTEVKLPIKEAIESNDAINRAKIAFTRYNEKETNSDDVPETLLMVRKKDMHRFFLRSQLADNETSYLTSLTSSKNQYIFSNIANLLRYCYDEYDKGIKDDPEWEEKNPDWDTIVLIPVKTILDTNNNVVKITHNTDISSLRLRGGNIYEIPIEIISSKFND